MRYWISYSYDKVWFNYVSTKTLGFIFKSIQFKITKNFILLSINLNFDLIILIETLLVLRIKIIIILNHFMINVF